MRVSCCDGQLFSLKSELARLWIAQGDFEEADLFVAQCGICGAPADGNLPYLKAAVYLILLRLHLAGGAYQPRPVFEFKGQVICFWLSKYNPIYNPKCIF